MPDVTADSATMSNMRRAAMHCDVNNRDIDAKTRIGRPPPNSLTRDACDAVKLMKQSQCI